MLRLELKLTVAGIPQPKARARQTRQFSKKHGRVITRSYTPAASANFNEAVQWAARHQMKARPFLTGVLFIRIVCFLPIPQSWPKWKKALAAAGHIMPTGKPDKDNLEKAVMDGLNEVVWKDDCTTVGGHTWKFYTPENTPPCTIVAIYSIENAFTAQQEIPADKRKPATPFDLAALVDFIPA